MKKLHVILILILSLLVYGYAISGPNVSMPGNSATDRTTGAVPTIDYAHHEIHDGSGFFVSGTTTIGSGITNALVFYVPNTAMHPHLTLAVSSSNILYVYFLEGSLHRTVNANTTSGATPYNHDRNSSVKSGCTVGWSPQWSGLTAANNGGHSVIGNSGVTIYYNYIGSSGLGNTGIGGAATRDAEIVLKSGTTYTLLLSSGAAGNQVGYNLQWYEHTNR